MRLQSDPTVVFSITEGKKKLGRKLFRKDLKFESEFNTYRNLGLPPQPICFPGIDSLISVSKPLESELLYFVAKNKNGEHYFSTNYKDHLRNVKAVKKKKIRKGLMLVLSSPSGAGKTSICKEILKRDNELDMSISITTRPRRKSEVEGKDYIFVSEKKFEKLKKENFFIEHAEVFDHFYGTPKKFVENNLESGRDVLFDIDWQGTQKLSNYSKTILFQFLFFHRAIPFF